MVKAEAMDAQLRTDVSNGVVGSNERASATTSVSSTPSPALTDLSQFLDESNDDDQDRFREAEEGVNVIMEASDEDEDTADETSWTGSPNNKNKRRSDSAVRDGGSITEDEDPDETELDDPNESDGDGVISYHNGRRSRKGKGLVFNGNNNNDDDNDDDSENLTESDLDSTPAPVSGKRKNIGRSPKKGGVTNQTQPPTLALFEPQSLVTPRRNSKTLIDRVVLPPLEAGASDYEVGSDSPGWTDATPEQPRKRGRPKGSTNKKSSQKAKAAASNSLLAKATKKSMAKFTSLAMDEDVNVGRSARDDTPGAAEGVRRSAREKRIRQSYAAQPELELNERDLNAPYMGQGDLRKATRKKTNVRVAGLLAEPGSGTEETGSGNISAGSINGQPFENAFNRGINKYTKKGDLDRLRREQITTILSDNTSGPLPAFPPEYGFKIEYFRTDNLPSPPSSTSSRPQSDDEEVNPPNPKRHKPSSPPSEDAEEEGYEPITGLYTFAPTKEVFDDFEKFVKDIGQIGRRGGVLKIKVPLECIPPPPPRGDAEMVDADDASTQTSMAPTIHQPPLQAASCHTTVKARRTRSRSTSRGRHSRSSSHASARRLIEQYPADTPRLNSFHQKVYLHKKMTTSFNGIYHIESITSDLGAPALKWKESWDARDRKYAADAGSVVADEEGMDEEAFLRRSCEMTKWTRRGFIATDGEPYDEGLYGDGKIVYSTDNEATPHLRSLFQLSNIDLTKFSGNTLNDTYTKVIGIHTPYLYFASPLTTFALHMEDYAALSINFHHAGAPKKWIVICPADSEKLENLLIGMLDLKPKDTSCNQFIRHQSIFVPSKILRRAGIRYTEVTQRPGDMIITFPWAYHQGWNAGLNVAEAIGYGNEGWQGWVRYYRVCKEGRCPVKPITLEFPEGFTDGGVNGVKVPKAMVNGEFVVGYRANEGTGGEPAATRGRGRGRGKPRRSMNNEGSQEEEEVPGVEQEQEQELEQAVGKQKDIDNDVRMGSVETLVPEGNEVDAATAEITIENNERNTTINTTAMEVEVTI